METETSTEPAVTPSPETSAAPAATPTPWEGFEWDGNVDALPGPVADAIRAARKDAGAARTNAKAQAAQEARDALIKELSAAAGHGTAEDPPDAAKLAEHLQQSRAETASVQVELRLLRLANKLGANADELLDSLSFRDAVDNLDVTDWVDFDTKVTELIGQRQAAQPRQTGPVTHRPAEALRPGAMPTPMEPNLDDQIAEAQKSGNVRRVIALQNQKLANHTT